MHETRGEQSVVCTGFRLITPGYPNNKGLQEGGVFLPKVSSKLNAKFLYVDLFRLLYFPTGWSPSSSNSTGDPNA